MDKLVKIGMVSSMLNVSTRAIRYYEEIGFIKSERIKSSNYRMYDENNINKLKQIIFLRRIQFSIDDIRVLLNHNDNNLKEKVLLKKYNEVCSSAMQLLNVKDILEAVIKVSREEGAEKINFYNVLSKQVYINSKNEEGISMEEKEILVEFGKGIIPFVDKNQGGTVIDSIKDLREELKEKYKITVPLIHLRDNEALSKYGYEISINNKKIFSGDINIYDEDKRKDELLKDIRNILIKNRKLL